MMSEGQESSDGAPRRAQWREPYLWLVIAAPLTAVIAGLATVVIAYRSADEIVRDPVVSVERRAAALEPALSARNAAAAQAVGTAPRPQP